MSISSKRYYQIAQEIEQEMEKETDEAKKKELKKVSAQNYFYSGIEALEFVLKKAGISIYLINNHKEKLEIVKKNSRQFKNPVTIALKYEILLNYDYRRKVAYKGENGNKFLILKEFAEACQKELE